MNNSFFNAVPFLFPSFAFSQNKENPKFTLTGFVKDTLNGEALIGVTIKIKGTSINAVSNNYGFYSLSLNPGFYALEIRYVGYAPLEEILI